MRYFFPGDLSRASTRSLMATMCMLAAATMIHAMDAPPEMVVGDKWTYRNHNKGDKREPYIYTQQVKSLEGGSAWMYYESQETNTATPRYLWRYDVKRAEFVERFSSDPSAGNGLGKRLTDRQSSEDTLQFPLAVGKKYKVKRPWDNGRGFDDLTAEVESLEKVKVEAGEFDAYRIRYSGFWNQREGGSYSGRVTWVRWYAPAVRQTVRSEYTTRTTQNQPWSDFQTELVKWEPAAK